ncbi:MAG: hypothetical protein R3D89_09940 [Sphingomonadaceae bacterium]
MRGKTLFISAGLGGLLLGVAVAAITPTRMLDFANEPWRGLLKPKAEAPEALADAPDEDEYVSRLSSTYHFVDGRRERVSRRDREAIARAKLRARMKRQARGSLERVSGAPAPTVPDPDFKPLGLADIGMTKHAPLPPPPPRDPVRKTAEPRPKADINRSDLATGIY